MTKRRSGNWRDDHRHADRRRLGCCCLSPDGLSRHPDKITSIVWPGRWQRSAVLPTHAALPSGGHSGHHQAEHLRDSDGIGATSTSTRSATATVGWPTSC